MKGPCTVLIVDDQKLSREALEVTLAAEGYQLLFASSGPEALAAVAKFQPDLVLLDVMMPGMDGFEVCRRLRADPHSSDIPIVLVTALDDRESRIAGIEAGADDFLSKPFDRIELRARVRTITRLNRYRRLLLERARFEWVVDQAADGYLILDQNDYITYANAQARVYLGLPAGEREPVGRSFLELADREYRREPPEGWLLWCEQPGSEGRTPLYLVQPESATSKAMWLQVDVLDPEYEPGRGQLLRLRNITAQIAAQRDMRTFHTMVSHKLRTPLSHVLTGTQILADQVLADSDADPVVSELAQMALAGALRLHGHVEDILQYARVRALALRGDYFRLGELDDMVNRIAADLGLQEVHTTVPGDLGGCSPVLSRQAAEIVLRELLENSRKFHPGLAPKVEVRAGLAAQQVSLCVEDDGGHLTPRQLAAAWVPYQQGEKDFTGEVAGTGLGLVTVASLVWEAGGACHIRNRPGRPGVAVELVIPLAGQEPAAEAPASTARSGL